MNTCTCGGCPACLRDQGYDPDASGLCIVCEDQIERAEDLAESRDDATEGTVEGICKHCAARGFTLANSECKACSKVAPYDGGPWKEDFCDDCDLRWMREQQLELDAQADEMEQIRVDEKGE